MQHGSICSVPEGSSLRHLVAVFCKVITLQGWRRVTQSSVAQCGHPRSPWSETVVSLRWGTRGSLLPASVPTVQVASLPMGPQPLGSHRKKSDLCLIFVQEASSASSTPVACMCC